jgi:hypothetical protein
MIIFITPVAMVFLVDELLYRIRNGPQPPDRHSSEETPEQGVHAFARMKDRLTRSWR